MFKQLKIRMLALGLALVLPTAGWADVNFAQKPLAAGGGVDPNLMFILDDSGSMLFEHMPDGLDDYYSVPEKCTGWGWSRKCTRSGKDANNRWYYSSRVNKLYYDPSISYSPPLCDNSYSRCEGGSFPNSSYGGAWNDGYSGDFGRNLSNDYVHRPFGSWTGSSTTLSFNQGGFYYKYAPSASDADSCDANPRQNKCYSYVSLNSESAEEKKNFANWYSYYRSREMAAKSGIGSVFANKDLSDKFRLGWGVINQGKHKVDDASNIRAVQKGVRPFESVKVDFLKWLYDGSASGSTPLQRALEGAGQYYEKSKRAWLDDPSASSGTGNLARECRISATMLMTDGYYNTGDDYDPDLSSYADDSDGAVITNGTGDSGQYKAVQPFSDGKTGRYTLADIAAYYWKRDLSDIGNYVPTIDAEKGEGIRQTVGNPAFWQHMMTYGIGFGVEGTVSRNDAVDAVIHGTSIDWWAGDTDEDKINDLLHASMNGRGDFFSAGDPETFRSELEGLLDQFLGRAGSATGLDFNVASIESADSALSFSSVFDPSGWSGDLKATTLTPDDSGRPVTTDPDVDGWSARAKLEGANFDTRTVLTYDGAKGVPFRLDSLTGAQKTDLRVGDATLDQLRVNYLRGKRKATIEAENPGKGKFFRDRSSLLGTIVNSTPRFAGVPDSSWPNSDKFGDGKYTVFRNNNLDRTPVVYVGANDGMLHGFRAKNKVEDGTVTASGGEEVLAYVPSFISSATEDEGLHYLTQPGYDHRYYVDLNLEVVDVHTKGRSLSGVDSTEKWRTVLIGGSRAGAKGIFALDVTNPDGFSEDSAAQNVLWEFTHEKLGYLVEPPEIAQMEWPDGSIRWTVFVPSGYNSGTTGFFMLDLEGGLDGTWTEWGASTGDYIYHEFDSSGTGLSPLTVVDNANDDYVVDRVYAGDLDGTMWVAYNKEGTMTTAYPDGYFKADQPITSAPAVGLGLGGGKDPNIMILFGTGKYLENSDSSNMDDQYFYSVLETSDAMDLPLTLADLVAAPVTNQSGTIDGTTRDIRVENAANVRVDYDTKRGWYTELPTNGERIVNYPIVRGEFVYVNTLIPGANPCLGGGDGYVMGFEILRSKTTTPSYAAFENSTEGAVGFRVGGGPSQLATWGNLLTFGTGSGGAEFIGLPELVLGLGRKGWREMTE